MADEADTQASQDASAENTAADSQSEEQTQDAAATSTEQSGEDQQGKTDTGTADASTGDKSKSETQNTKQESKPLSRRSAAYRINQLLEENKALKQQQKPKEQQDDWEDTAQDEPKPDIAALVAKEVERRLHPVISESTKAADEAELSELFSGDRASERSKYEPQIREMWKLPQYKDTAAADLYKIVSFDEAVANATAKAVEEYKKAEKEAKESSGSGSNNTSNRTGKGGKSVNDLSDEEFLKRNERIKAGLPV